MKPQPVLSDMPRHIKQSIVDYVDPATKHDLRQCSKEFKTLVANSPVKYDHIYIRPSEGFIKIEFDYTFRFHHRVSLTLKNVRGDVCIQSSEWQTIKPRKDEIKLAVDLVMKVLGNPKVSLRELDILPEPARNASKHSRIVFRMLGQLHSKLKKLNRQISVEGLTLPILQNMETAHLIMPYLKPGVLKWLSFTNQGLCNDEVLHPFAQLEQWKKAWGVHTWWRSQHYTSFTTTLPFDNWKHFEITQLRIRHLTIQVVKDVIKNFCDNPNIRHTWLRFSVCDRQEILDYLKPILDGTPLHIHFDEYMFRVSRNPYEFLRF